MSTDSLLEASVDRLFAAIAGGPVDAGVWTRIEEMGIADLLLPEAEGGMGTGWQDAAVVFRLSGYHALALPASETMIARKWLHDSGIAIAPGPVALAVSADGSFDARSACFSGTVSALTHTLSGSRLLVTFRRDDRERMLILDADAAQETRLAGNMAGEQIPVFRFDRSACTPLTVDGDKLLFAGALMRTTQMAGALAACLEKCIAYTGERTQFGRPLRKFQVIQHQIAVIAEEAAAASSAAAAAAAAAALGIGDGQFEIAAAKLRANQAAGTVAGIAHQIHGAIGITEEFGLHRHTQRLWAWRGEFGNDRTWSEWLGKYMLRPTSASAWSILTSRGQP